MTDCTSCCSTVCQDALTVFVVGAATIVVMAVMMLVWVYAIEPVLNTQLRRNALAIMFTLIALPNSVVAGFAIAWWTFFAVWCVWAMLIVLVAGLSNVAEGGSE